MPEARARPIERVGRFEVRAAAFLVRDFRELDAPRVGEFREDVGRADDERVRALASLEDAFIAAVDDLFDLDPRCSLGRPSGPTDRSSRTSSIPAAATPTTAAVRSTSFGIRPTARLATPPRFFDTPGNGRPSRTKVSGISEALARSEGISLDGFAIRHAEGDAIAEAAVAAVRAGHARALMKGQIATPALMDPPGSFAEAAVMTAVGPAVRPLAGVFTGSAPFVSSTGPCQATRPRSSAAERIRLARPPACWSPR